MDNIRKSEKTLKKLYPGAVLADVTSKAKDDLIKLSPFYPHGDIPIPFSEGYVAKSVEGIWQGLKVFEDHDVDIAQFENDTMKNIKRTVRKYGTPLGHRKGVNGTELLDYISARIEIYLPSYQWVLIQKVPSIISRLRKGAKVKDIVLLDYATNGDILDPRKPLSHAFLVKAFVEGFFPTKAELFSRFNKMQESEVEYYPLKKAPERQPKYSLGDIEMELILEAVKKKPKSSRMLIDELNLNFSSLKLTKELKRHPKIRVVNSKPLKFTSQNPDKQIGLF